jgi:hypothetical protein
MANLIEEVRKYRNVKIVNSPVFNYYYIENDILLNKSCSVSTIFLPSTINHIKMNQNIIFHIFEISEQRARWYEEYNEQYVRELRKEKIEKINNNI